ncbi:DUF3718 domain-containing protein [Aestuariibacter halophilus]|uniref:DUF3718 domain-containing protein n=1 Tax=Fluctibacter halophilus TaxID=226011 RepID=A0ABS8G7Q8_9ALTE|nr:DUF3718 domain-containing protein [Aestuariibacter halophilus]MCC2616622.1 DUF3718 domain-containing protein [Aestuariibacter halophilus]
MKKVIIAIAATLSLGTSAMAQATMKYDESTEQNLVNICKALKSGSVLDLKRAVKRARVNYRAVADDLMCNGQSAHQFAVSNNATKTADLLAKRANLDVDNMLAKR